MRQALQRPWIVAIALSGAITSCSDEPAVLTIETDRATQDARPFIPVESARRFGFASREPGPAPSPSFSWSLPAGWVELPPGMSRAGSFELPGGVDCSLTVLSGSAGGVIPNLDRWRGQMGQPALTSIEIDALETTPLLGGVATRITIEGTYSGMGEVTGGGGSKLVGLVLPEASRTIFLKMVGPLEAVDAQADAFEAFLDSLRRGAGGAAPHAGAGAGGAPHAGMPGGVQPTPNQLDLQWTAPDGWETGPPRTMRLVTLSPTDAPDVECYVVILGGDGGGVDRNIDLWRGQMGLSATTPGDIAALERVDALGVQAPLVEITGMAQSQGRAMLGLVCPLGSHSVFVKMLGPATDVAASRADFLAFCRSLSR